MTTKEIAETAGCSRRVAAETIKAVFPEKVRKGATTDLSEKEALAIMGRLPKRNLVQPRTKVLGQEVVDQMMRAIATQNENINKLCTLIASLIPVPTTPALAQIEAPKMTDRATLNKLVREYATSIGGDFKAAWGALYNAALYRLHANLPARAEHSGRAAIDIAEEEGLLPELVAIAREVLK